MFKSIKIILIRLLFDPTRRDLFKPEEKKLEKFGIFRGKIFQIQTQTKDGWPDLSYKKLTRPITNFLHEFESALNALLGIFFFSTPCDSRSWKAH